ncbi:MAG: hypothetical protein KJO54_00910 [Gammaproteobacteria bacterium]|nr:hypothetical protein [Gammaproteobacteria bacterium]NNF61745.1 hypothetical protein [Gammaproteobacteria bacterium]NNM21773.1 hypothetical protein [Gammaproteobacteria bacterium]
MIDERTRELINGALDGELTDAELKEMDQNLAMSAEARRYLAGMSDLDSFLKNLPAEALPDEVHGNILRNVTLPAASAPAPHTSRAGMPVLLRYGFATAAGLLLAVGIYRYMPQAAAPGDLEQMIGTMAPGNAVAIDTFSFESADVGGSASLHLRDDTLVLSITIDSVNPIDIDIDFAGTSLEFEALAKTDNDLESFEYATRAISARSRGRQNFAVVLQRNAATTDKDGAIRLDFTSNGILIHQGTLVPRW